MNESDVLLMAVRTHVDTVLDAIDQLPQRFDRAAFVDGLQTANGQPLYWRQFPLCNLARQQHFCRTLVALTELTGAPHYRQRAVDAVAATLARAVDPKSRMLYWGGHSCLDAYTGQPMLGNHELKSSYPFWEFLYEVNPAATTGAIEGMWNKHMRDWANALFNRHGEYNWWRRGGPQGSPPAWEHEFQPGALPLSTSPDQGYSFISTGSDLVAGAGVLSHCSGAAAPGTWASRLAKQYDRTRHPQTHLGALQFNHEEDCRVRQSLVAPWSQRADVNECTLITRGGIEMRYGLAAAGNLTLAAQLRGELGALLLDMTTRDLLALGKFSFDPGLGAFRPLLWNGEQFPSNPVIPGAGYLLPEEMEPVPVHGVLLLAYARASQMTRQPELETLLLQMVRAQGLAEAWQGNSAALQRLPRLSPAPANLSPDGPEPSLYDACTLIAALDGANLAVAEMIAHRLLHEYQSGPWLLPARRSDGGGAEVTLDNTLPLALLHVVAARPGAVERLPRFYPTCNFFDPKVVARRLTA